MLYAIIPLVFALATGFVGRRKGSSFFIWLIIGVVLPGVGLFAALVFRNENHDPRRPCPRCDKLLPIASQVCPRCGEDLAYPDQLVVPRAAARS